MHQNIEDGLAADFGVIGAGITGLSIALHLAGIDAGKVLIFDGRGVGSGATGIQPGGVRQQWSSATTCRMARESYAFYRDFDEQLEPAVSPGFEPCGYVFVAESQTEFERLESLVTIQNSASVPSQTLTPTEVGALVPGLNADAIVGASYCAEDGYFDRPQAVVAGFAAACERRGAMLVGEHVRRIVSDGDGWGLELANGSNARVGQVIVAAGWETAALVEPLGLDLPIEREARYLLYSDPIRERLLEPLVVSHERHVASKQLADGSVLASDLSATGDPDANRNSWHRTIRETITALVPILEYVSFPTLVEGFYDVTPDRQPILGALDGHPGLWVAAGLNGRGLMMAPVIGRVLANAAIGGTPDATLRTLAASRFAEGLLEAESNVV